MKPSADELRDLQAAFGVHPRTLTKRLDLGWPIEWVLLRGDQRTDRRRGRQIHRCTECDAPGHNVRRCPVLR